jgi:hypothetical protein
MRVVFGIPLCSSVRCCGRSGRVFVVGGAPRHPQCCPESNHDWGQPTCHLTFIDRRHELDGLSRCKPETSQPPSPQPSCDGQSHSPSHQRTTSRVRSHGDSPSGGGPASRLPWRRRFASPASAMPKTAGCWGACVERASLFISPQAASLAAIAASLEFTFLRFVQTLVICAQLNITTPSHIHSCLTSDLCN